jgi:hypothetical protein
MRIQLSEKSFQFIEAYKTVYELERNNSGPVVCRDCKKEIVAGLGIYRRAYRRNGYLCFACFAKDIEIVTSSVSGDPGFFVDTLGRLRACFLSSPSFSTVEIVEAVFRSMLETSYNSIEILLGAEGAHPFAIFDAAEASI